MTNENNENESPNLGLFEIIFFVEDADRDFALYTTKMDYEHSRFCQSMDMEDDLQLMTVEDLESLIESLQERINKIKASE